MTMTSQRRGMVIPTKVGIQPNIKLDARLRGHDD